VGTRWVMSSGIGYELAAELARRGCDLLVAAGPLRGDLRRVEGTATMSEPGSGS
jgi:NAD(P)-dependent dehydrogenase (short-subunit alcohol dehydrogenase family)